MILSVSRRTDIPAFYGAWFLNRLEAGWLLVPNPRNPKRLNRVELTPENVDMIVFLTKNPGPMLGLLDRLDALGYEGRYCFQVSLTAFESRVEEKGLPPKARLVEYFQELSRRLGPERVDWRFDPIMVNASYTAAWHTERFQLLARALGGYTRRCIISFIDFYRHLGAGFPEMSVEDKREAARGIGAVSAEIGLPVFTCAEDIDLQEFGIRPAPCLDALRFGKIIGASLAAGKAKGQRQGCLCAESVDVGIYDTCLNGCSYCYATTSRRLAALRYKNHDPQSPLLTGWPSGQEIVDCRRQGSLKEAQLDLFGGGRRRA
ncbi:MAG: DUF1848 domain-containing protein [Peptococcaceae bacterium]|nr:DUF1848 domain-containing protein [Peptococcaceae bacterium]